MVSINTPADCIKILEKSYKTKEELSLTIDETTINHGFKVSKENGNNKYLYFSCHKSGEGRTIPEEEKERNTKSQKIGKLILLI
jgi:hypothetical protein